MAIRTAVGRYLQIDDWKLTGSSRRFDIRKKCIRPLSASLVILAQTIFEILETANKDNRHAVSHFARIGNRKMCTLLLS